MRDEKAAKKKTKILIRQKQIMYFMRSMMRSHANYSKRDNNSLLILKEKQLLIHSYRIESNLLRVQTPSRLNSNQ